MTRWLSCHPILGSSIQRMWEAPFVRWRHHGNARGHDGQVQGQEDESQNDERQKLSLTCFRFFSKFNSERLHPSSAHDDSQDDLQLISTYEYRRSLYRSYILRISCHCMFQIYSSSSQRFCWWIAQEELTKLRSKETEAKHSYEMLTQSLQDWSSQRIKGLFGSQCSMQHWCEPILVFLLWICRMICPHI